MKHSEVVTLLTTIASLVGKTPPTSVDVNVWAETPEVQAWTLDEALTAARSSAMGGSFVGIKEIKDQIRQSKGKQSDVRIESHCGISACRCTHEDDCFKGWIDGETTTRPCPTCRPNLATRVSKVPPPGQRTPADLATLRKP